MSGTGIECNGLEETGIGMWRDWNRMYERKDWNRMYGTGRYWNGMYVGLEGTGIECQGLE